MSKVYTWTDRTPKGFLNDELETVWTQVDTNATELDKLDVHANYIPIDINSGIRSGVGQWTNNSFGIINFDTGQVDLIRYNVLINPNLGSSITLDVALRVTSNGTSTTDIQYSYELAKVSSGNSIPTQSFTTGNLWTPSGTNAQIDSITLNTSLSVSGGDVVAFCLRRDGTTDSNPNNLWLVGIGLLVD